MFYPTPAAGPAARAAVARFPPCWLPFSDSKNIRLWVAAEGACGRLGLTAELVNSSAVGPVVQSGPARGPVKAEIAGSNPVGTARKEFLPASGEVAEWLKAVVSKTTRGSKGSSRVQIPPSPPKRNPCATSDNPGCRC